MTVPQVRITGTVPAIGGPVHLATDASEDPRRVAGGYLSTTGHYGVHAHMYPRKASGVSRTVVAELRAVLWGLQDVLATIGISRPVTVHTDSTCALSYLHAWQQGSTHMPPGYRATRRSPGPRSLVELQQLAEYTPGLTFVHVKGHAGHPLNEAADYFARLGLRCSRGTVPRARVTELAPQWARDSLTEFRTTRTREVNL
ncbi:RNase H family protein [Streptomyces sp. DH37]|uniref:RNase H family protein n=1 Tax=Streptomyces sp. DH37 TaxID=3040122 RepID=UPI002441D122|nr:RNase H family protein [Streptomyces sp. DH37]MDG9703768.1 hypothetical protein [Streptomyces sp. DH37]